MTILLPAKSWMRRRTPRHYVHTINMKQQPAVISSSGSFMWRSFCVSYKKYKRREEEQEHVEAASTNISQSPVGQSTSQTAFLCVDTTI